MIILPRQARDKHKKNSKKSAVFLQYGEAKPEHMDAAHAAGLKVAFSLKDLYAGTKWCPSSITDGASEERVFKQRVTQVRAETYDAFEDIQSSLPPNRRKKGAN